MALSVGQQAPNFTLSSTSGKDFALHEHVGKPCIFYFYPKNFTPGCNKEACDFRDHFQAFRELEIDVYGISTDSIKSHLKFKNEYKLPFDLLSDKSGKVSKLYQAHIPVINVSKRVTYLLDKQHQIKAVYSDMFGAKNHIKEMVKQVNG